ncbi:MAG: transporter substrate-binding domain-containing protein, partial [FCB group bacterium]|nr:transporter substrate-binding domain-containing protein [FCB group bacterium]
MGRIGIMVQLALDPAVGLRGLRSGFIGIGPFGLLVCLAAVLCSSVEARAHALEPPSAASAVPPRASGQSSLPLTPEEQSWLIAHPVVTLSVDDTYSPRNFRDDNGQLVGVSIDYVRLLGKRLGITIQFEGSSWNEALEKALRHEVDGVINADWLEERKPYLNFTEVYLEYPQALVVRRDEPPLKALAHFEGRRVAAKSGSSQLAVLQDRFPGITITPVSDLDQGLDLLIEGRVDGLFDDMGCLYDLMSKRFLSNLKFGLVYRDPPIGHARLGLRNDEPLLLSVFNKAIASVTAGDRKRLQEAWMPEDIPSPNSASAGAPVVLSEEEAQWLSEHPRIVITTDMNSPPYIFRDETGQACGILQEIGERIERGLGIEVEWAGENYEALVESVREGTADVTTLNDPLDTPYQASYIKTRDFIYLPYSLWVRKDSPLLSNKSLTLQGQRIVLVEGWDLKHPFLSTFEGNSLVKLPDATDCISAVLNGRADALLEVYGIIDHMQQKNLVRDLAVLNVFYDGCPAAFYVRKDWPELHSALDKSLASIPREEYRSILSRWASHMDDPALRLKVLNLSPEERAWLRSNPTVRVASDAHWEPIEYLGESGEIEGVANDYLTRIEQMLGIRFEVVPTRNWDEAMTALRAGKMDMAPAIVQTPDRMEYLDFTAPYLSLPAGIFSRDEVTYLGGLERLAGKRVGVVEGESIQKLLVAEHPELLLVASETIPDALHALARGETDVFVGNVAVTTHYIRKIGLAQLKVVGETPYRFDVAMAVSKEDPVLYSILTKALDALSSREREGIFQKWFTVKYEHGFDYNLLWEIAATVILIVGAFIAWNRWLAKVVKKRTAALSAANEQLHAEIEERAQAEKALLASEERFRALFELLPYSCVVTDTEGRYRLVNRAFLKQLGIEHEEAIGRNQRELGLFADDKGSKEVLARLGETGSCENVELVIRIRDRSAQHLLISSRLVELNGERQILSAAVDITERKKIEDRMRRVTECLLSLGPDYEQNVRHITALCGILLGGNAAFYRRIANDTLVSVGEWGNVQGYSKETTAAGTVCAELIRNSADGPLAIADLPTAPYPQTVAAAALNGWKSYLGHSVRSGAESGGALCVLFSAHTVPNEGDRRIMGILSAALGAEEQRHRAEEQLRQAQKMEAVGQLAGGVAHDFNNLLQVINGFTEVALEELAGESPVRDLLKEVAKAGDRSARLVRQLLTFSRRQVMRPENLDIDEVVASVLKMLARVLGEHIVIRFAPGGEGKYVCADRGQMEQVLTNLSVNARDAMPEGGILSIETEEVKLDEEFCDSRSWAAPGRFVMLCVSDSGCGIDPGIIKRIFDPFFTTKEVGRGTGLGLATVYGIVRQHGGLIDVSSEPGKGTTFKIYLPKVSAGPEEVQKPELGQDNGGTEVILLAEDEDMVREVTRLVLEKAGYRVICARDGEEAVAMAEERGFEIALALLDVVMPGLGGRAVYERLKGRFPQMRFLFTSGYNVDGVHT